MQKIKSPTGCVHAVAGGTKGFWFTKCNHTNYFRTDGYEHNWPLTDDKVTCKRCLKLMKPDEVIEFKKGGIITPDKVFDILEDAGAVVHEGYNQFSMVKNFKIIVEQT